MQASQKKRKPNVDQTYVFLMLLLDVIETDAENVVAVEEWVQDTEVDDDDFSPPMHSKGASKGVSSLLSCHGDTHKSMKTANQDLMSPTYA